MANFQDQTLINKHPFDNFNFEKTYGQENEGNKTLQTHFENETGSESFINFQSPYPFTSDDLLLKILHVTALNQFASKPDVEKIFGINLQYFEKLSEKNNIAMFGVKRPRDWYFDLDLITKSRSGSSFYFGWGKDPGMAPSVYPLPPEGMCINIGSFSSSLIKQGWSLKSEMRESPLQPEDTYQKSGVGILRVTSDWKNHCLLDLLIYDDKNS